MNRIATRLPLCAALAGCGDKDSADPVRDPTDSAETGSPPAVDPCDGLDNDGDGRIDEDEPPQTWYYDMDRDGYGRDGDTTTACDPPTGYAAAGGDCDDGDAAISPGEAEECDGLDDDCDGEVDEDFPGDSDADGAADCLDGEECDGLDNDGDGAVDEGAAGMTRFYPDKDGDGYGAPGMGLYACEPPPNSVDNDDDCDDDDPAVTPLLETCTCSDGKDNDGDGLADCEDGECAGDSACQEDCSDEDDNDLDGLVDCDDDDCWGSLDACQKTLAWVNGGYFRGGTRRTTLVDFEHGTGHGSFPWNSAWSVSGSIRLQSPIAGTYTCAWTLDSAYWADQAWASRESMGGIFESWEGKTYRTPPVRSGLQLSPDCPVELDLADRLPSYVGAGAAAPWGAAVYWYPSWAFYEVPGASHWYSAASWNSALIGSSWEVDEHDSSWTVRTYTWSGALAPGDAFDPAFWPY